MSYGKRYGLGGWNRRHWESRCIYFMSFHCFKKHELLHFIQLIKELNGLYMKIHMSFLLYIIRSKRMQWATLKMGKILWLVSEKFLTESRKFLICLMVILLILTIKALDLSIEVDKRSRMIAKPWKRSINGALERLKQRRFVRNVIFRDCTWIMLWKWNHKSKKINCSLQNIYYLSIYVSR